MKINLSSTCIHATTSNMILFFSDNIILFNVAIYETINEIWKSEAEMNSSVFIVMIKYSTFDLL